jgi:hypothetical protein
MFRLLAVVVVSYPCGIPSLTTRLDDNTKGSHDSDIRAPHAIIVISLARKFQTDRNCNLNENLIPES